MGLGKGIVVVYYKGASLAVVFKLNILRKNFLLLPTS